MPVGNVSWGTSVAGESALPVAIMRWLAMRSGGSGQPSAPEARPMRDYLGGEVAGAMGLIKALAPQPQPMGAPPPPVAIGVAPPARRGGGMIKGPGDGRSDSVPAQLGAMDAVRVSDGEFVIPADVVSALGRGSSDAGSRKLAGMVTGVRSDYRKHLGSLPQPTKGRGDKLFGGLFESQQETEIEQPRYIRDVGGNASRLLRGVWQSRLPVEDVAGFTPDQIASMDALRAIGSGDPYGVDAAYNNARGTIDRNQAYYDAGQGTLAGQQGRIAGAQDAISGQFGNINDAQARLRGQYGYLDQGQGQIGRGYGTLDAAEAGLAGQDRFLNQGQGQIGQGYGVLDRAGRRVEDQYGFLDEARGRVGGAQDYLGDVLGPGGDNQRLIDATLGSFDYQRDKDIAAAARNRAGRGAFGERRAIAEDEESVASNLARAGLEAGLRDDAISRRMAAASQIGNLSNVTGSLTGQAGNLASTSGQLAGLRSNLAGAQGQLVGQGANLASTRGQLAGQRGQLAGAQGQLVGQGANVAGTQGQLAGTAGNLSGQIGSLAGTSGNLVGQSGDLASRSNAAAASGADLAAAARQLGISDAELLSRIGAAQQTQNQRVLDAPYERVSRGSSFISGAPSTTSTTTSQSPLQSILGLGALAGGFISRDGGMVPGKKARMPKRKDYAYGGQIGAVQQQQPMPMQNMQMGWQPPAQVGPPQQQVQPQTQVQPQIGAPVGLDVARPMVAQQPVMPAVQQQQPAASPAQQIGAAVQPQTQQVQSDPVASGRVWGGGALPPPSVTQQAGVSAQSMPQIDAPPSVMPGMAKAFGNTMARPPGYWQARRERRMASGLPIYSQQQMGAGMAFADGGLMGAPAGFLERLPNEALANLLNAPASVRMSSGVTRGDIQRELERRQATNDAEAAKFGAGANEAIGAVTEPVGDALGMNSLGPDEDAAGGRPNVFEMRAMRDRTVPAATVVPPGAPARPPALAVPKRPKPPLMDRVNAILAKGQPAQAARPGARPAMLVSPEEPLVAGVIGPRGPGLGNFMPESKTRGPEPAAIGNEPAKGRSFRDRVEGALENPLTQFGLALLASQNPTLGGAIGEAGLTTARNVSERKRQERQDAKEAEATALALRRLGLSEEQAKIYAASQQALQEDRTADNRRQETKDAAEARRADERLGIQRQNAASLQGYRNAQLGISRKNLARLQKQTDAIGSGDPTKKVLGQKLREGLAQAMIEDDQELADRIRQQLAALGLGDDGGEDALGALPPGFALDDDGLRDGGRVKKRKC